MLNPKQKELLSLIEAYGIEKYEVTDSHYGNSHKGPLLKVIIYDRFIFDPSSFNELGYGVVCCESKMNNLGIK